MRPKQPAALPPPLSAAATAVVTQRKLPLNRRTQMLHTEVRRALDWFDETEYFVNRLNTDGRMERLPKAKRSLLVCTRGGSILYKQVELEDASSSLPSLTSSCSPTSARFHPSNPSPSRLRSAPRSLRWTRHPSVSESEQEQIWFQGDS